MVSTRRQKQEEPPALATQPKVQIARGGLKKAVATKEPPIADVKVSTATKASAAKKAPAPKKPTTTRSRANKGKTVEDEDLPRQEDQQITGKTTRAKKSVKDDDSAAKAPTRATRARAASKATQSEEPQKTLQKKNPSKDAPAAHRAPRIRGTRKDTEEVQIGVEPEIEGAVETGTLNEASDHPPPVERKTRATATKTTKVSSRAKAPVASSKSRVKSAPKKTTKTTTTTTAITRATRGTRSKKVPEVPDEDFEPATEHVPSVIKIEMAAIRAPTLSPGKAASASLLRMSPSKSIMQKIAELPTTSSIVVSPSKLPRPQDNDVEMMDSYDALAPTPLFQRSDALNANQTPSMKSSLFTVSARKPPGSVRRLHAMSPSQALVKPPGQAVDEHQKLGSSLFSRSPKKLHAIIPSKAMIKPPGQTVDERQKAESSLFSASPKKLHMESMGIFGAACKNKRPAEGGETQSSLTASPRKVKLTSPTMKFDNRFPETSASVQRPFGKSSLNSSPRRMKTPGRTPKTAPISSIRAFLDSGTPTKAPPRFTLPTQDVIIESEEADVTMVFEEPQFPCDVLPTAIESNPMGSDEDDVFAIGTAQTLSSYEAQEVMPETPGQERGEPEIIFTENGLNELATPALRRSDVIHERSPIAEISRSVLKESHLDSLTQAGLAEDISRTKQAQETEDDLSIFINTTTVETEILPDLAMNDSIIANLDQKAPASADSSILITLNQDPHEKHTLPSELPVVESDAEAPLNVVPSTPSTPKQMPVPIMLPLSTAKRPKMSPRKSSLRSPEKKSFESPRKTVTWQQLEQNATPSKNDGILDGMTFYVDTRTNDQVDQSYMFVSYLERAGAVCVPQWSSNSMGVTHVLWMNGDIRTLEKVVASDGAVTCVNVGWAVACENSGKRIDESAYLTDLSCVPGNSPVKPLSTLSANSSPLMARTPSRSPFKPVSTPFTMKPLPPSPQISFDDFDKENSPAMTTGGSPATPYFLHKEELIQRTCPPKQNNKPLFSGSLSSSSFADRLTATKRRRSDVGGTTSGRTPKRSRPALRDIFE
ncbi:hypothetical protein EJ05DRAFT_118362 [Pseudovirgaria hyperparasitica]|uniref:BRCT domain-containing protein n=1 Tax=Pseudovirgaria hyperparasitica TaxID=470096 RepID=A0A6A6VYS3_9PEZI|nr:uncharacterized protein EJ05DRAFT_118362 [Pseudovirgaria hyperparasitica]KAF2754986.1 hypothetical protein EJ05DRAFT_118362 [Pseudovirgaria hyperparasitica]